MCPTNGLQWMPGFRCCLQSDAIGRAPLRPDVRAHVKTYCLSPISSRSAAAERLIALLPGQHEPWLLRDGSGDVVAYFNIDDTDPPGALSVLADISGRHYNSDAEVVSVLEQLRAHVGGEISYAP
jgi:hypothetical protein